MHFQEAELFCGLLLPFDILLFSLSFYFMCCNPILFFVTFLLTCIYHKLRKAFFKSLLPTLRVDCLIHYLLKDSSATRHIRTCIYGGLVYNLKELLESLILVINLKIYIKCYKRVGYNMDIMWQSACLDVNPIMVDSYVFFFDCTRLGQASFLITAMIYRFYLLFGAWCLLLARPIVAQLKVFFSSDYLWVMSSFLCIIIMC